MITKIIRMVSQFGETNIDSLMSWFPQADRNEVIDKITKSNELSLIGDVVSLKKTVSVNELDLSLDTILQLIEKYNNKINSEYESLLVNTEENKLKTVIGFLERRYTLNKFDNEAELHIFVLLEKETLVKKGYAVITSILTENIYERLDSMFNNETVFIYYTDINEYGECRTTKDFYIKSCEAILDEYLITYKLNYETAQIAVIETIIGGNYNE